MSMTINPEADDGGQTWWRFEGEYPVSKFVPLMSACTYSD